jgi:hypothetical protein
MAAAVRDTSARGAATGGDCTVSAGSECDTQQEGVELAIIGCSDGTREVKLSFGA